MLPPAPASLALLALVVSLVPAPHVAQRGGRGGGASSPPPQTPSTTPPAQQPAPGSRARPEGDDQSEPRSAPTPPPREELTPEQRAAKYFGLADYDGDGFVSYFEAQKSLALDRTGFATYDRDRDGLVNAAEFEQRYVAILERGGAFVPPVPKPEARKAPRRDASALLDVYDSTPDRALEARELRKALDDYGVTDPPWKVLLETLDRDVSTKLEESELEALITILMPKEPEPETAVPKARSLAELFGKRVERERGENTPASVAVPPQIAGPVSMFRRLDLDDDGQIELDDLTELQRPVQMHVRVNAVFASFDLDGDGVISAEEFERAFRTRKLAERKP